MNRFWSMLGLGGGDQNQSSSTPIIAADTKVEEPNSRKRRANEIVADEPREDDTITKDRFFFTSQGPAMFSNKGNKKTQIFLKRSCNDLYDVKKLYDVKNQVVPMTSNFLATINRFERLKYIWKQTYYHEYQSKLYPQVFHLYRETNNDANVEDRYNQIYQFYDDGKQKYFDDSSSTLTPYLIDGMLCTENVSLLSSQKRYTLSILTEQPSYDLIDKMIMCDSPNQLDILMQNISFAWEKGCQLASQYGLPANHGDLCNPLLIRYNRHSINDNFPVLMGWRFQNNASDNIKNDKTQLQQLRDVIYNILSNMSFFIHYDTYKGSLSNKPLCSLVAKSHFIRHFNQCNQDTFPLDFEDQDWFRHFSNIAYELGMETQIETKSYLGSMTSFFQDTTMDQKIDPSFYLRRFMYHRVNVCTWHVQNCNLGQDVKMKDTLLLEIQRGTPVNDHIVALQYHQFGYHSSLLQNLDYVSQLISCGIMMPRNNIENKNNNIRTDLWNSIWMNDIHKYIMNICNTLNQQYITPGQQNVWYNPWFYNHLWQVLFAPCQPIWVSLQSRFYTIAKDQINQMSNRGNFWNIEQKQLFSQLSQELNRYNKIENGSRYNIYDQILYYKLKMNHMISEKNPKDITNFIYGNIIADPDANFDFDQWPLIHLFQLRTVNRTHIETWKALIKSSLTNYVQDHQTLLCYYFNHTLLPDFVKKQLVSDFFTHLARSQQLNNQNDQKDEKTITLPPLLSYWSATMETCTEQNLIDYLNRMPQGWASLLSIEQLTMYLMDQYFGKENGFCSFCTRSSMDGKTIRFNSFGNHAISTTPYFSFPLPDIRSVLTEYNDPIICKKFKAKFQIFLQNTIGNDMNKISSKVTQPTYINTRANNEALLANNDLFINWNSYPSLQSFGLRIIDHQNQSQNSVLPNTAS